MSLYEFECEKRALGYKYICGVDEAGRGPLAGPVFAAAVILPEDHEIEGLNDSKKLSEKKRDKLFDEIIEHALAFSIQSCDNFVIDEINILAATMLAMKNSVESVEIKPEIVFVDGNRLPKLEVPAEYVIKGDATSASIAAASILAKVSRDRFMCEMDEKYPGYCFEKHKGYPTKQHYERIKELGPSEIHRMTFLKKCTEGGSMVTEKRRRGNLGEDFAAKYLQNEGYTILERNFNTRMGEIDIIAKKDKYIAFIEVKSRADDCMYLPREAVTPAKQKKICKAAMLYSIQKGFAEQPRFDVFEIIYGRNDLEVKSFTHIKNAFGTEAVHGFF